MREKLSSSKLFKFIRVFKVVFGAKITADSNNRVRAIV